VLLEELESITGQKPTLTKLIELGLDTITCRDVENTDEDDLLKLLDTFSKLLNKKNNEKNQRRIYGFPLGLLKCFHDRLGSEEVIKRVLNSNIFDSLGFAEVLATSEPEKMNLTDREAKKAVGIVATLPSRSFITLMSRQRALSLAKWAHSLAGNDSLPETLSNLWQLDFAKNVGHDSTLQWIQQLRRRQLSSRTLCTTAYQLKLIKRAMVTFSG
jgi:hypothetical protein